VLPKELQIQQPPVLDRYLDVPNGYTANKFHEAAAAHHGNGTYDLRLELRRGISNRTHTTHEEREKRETASDRKKIYVHVLALWRKETRLQARCVSAGVRA